MDAISKINRKIYLSLNIFIFLIILIFFARGYVEVLIFALVQIVSLLNQLMLLSGLNFIFTTFGTKLKTTQIAKVTFLLFGKTIILGFGFYMAIQFMRDKILLCLFIYTVQLINLAISLKYKEFKK